MWLRHPLKCILKSIHLDLYIPTSSPTSHGQFIQGFTVKENFKDLTPGLNGEQGKILTLLCLDVFLHVIRYAYLFVAILYDVRCVKSLMHLYSFVIDLMYVCFKVYLRGVLFFFYTSFYDDS